jgi:hypothetical protein
MPKFMSEVVDALQLDSWWVILLFVGLAVAVVWNAVNRARWDIAWAAAGNAAIDIPERRWTYDAQDLEQFAEPASRTNLLPLYQRILRSSDLGFAFFVAAVSTYIWWRIADTRLGCPVVNWAALPLGAMAILYGIADIAEDLKLSSILEHPNAIDRAEAAATNMLTRIKLVTICLSLIGLVIFCLYWVAEKCAVRLLGRSRQRATA